MSLRQAQLHEYKQVADVLYDAFGLDFIDYYTKGDGWTEQQKIDFVRHRFECKVWANIKCGHVYIVGDEVSDCEGIALWFGPGQEVDRWTRLRSGMTRVYYMLGPNGRRILYEKLGVLMSDTKKQVLGPDSDNAWYLGMLATRKRARGKGYARLLVEEGTRHADEQGLKTYLESSSLKNCTLYEKLGFERKTEIVLPESDPVEKFYAMLRLPNNK